MKTLTTTEKINQIRQNDKVNDMIERCIELMQEIDNYTCESLDEGLSKKFEELEKMLEQKYDANYFESIRFSKEIINGK